jgi:hypothetical protein
MRAKEGIEGFRVKECFSRIRGCGLCWERCDGERDGGRCNRRVEEERERNSVSRWTLNEQVWSCVAFDGALTGVAWRP